MSVSEVSKILEVIRTECITQKRITLEMTNEYQEDKDEWYKTIKNKYHIDRDIIEPHLDKIMSDLVDDATRLSIITAEIPVFSEVVLSGKKSLMGNPKCKNLAQIWLGDEYDIRGPPSLERFKSELIDSGKNLTAKYLINLAIERSTKK